MSNNKGGRPSKYTSELVERVEEMNVQRSKVNGSAIDFDLRGKDWLTEAEAAHYCGVSLRQFQDHARRFRARRFMGKKLYSKAELFDAINQAPLWHAPEDPASSGLLSGRLSNVRLRPYRPRKKQDDGDSTAS